MTDQIDPLENASPVDGRQLPLADAEIEPA